MFLHTLHGDVLEWAKISCISPPPSIDLGGMNSPDGREGWKQIMTSIRAKWFLRRGHSKSTRRQGLPAEARALAETEGQTLHTTNCCDISIRSRKKLLSDIGLRSRKSAGVDIVGYEDQVTSKDQECNVADSRKSAGVYVPLLSLGLICCIGE
jgi:hypothetical protein